MVTRNEDTRVGLIRWYVALSGLAEPLGILSALLRSRVY